MPNEKPTGKSKHAAWTIYVFLMLSLFVSGLIVWQLWGLTPENWCLLAKMGDKTDPMACFNTLVRLLDVKDHIVIGVLATQAIIVICLAVVVLNLDLKASGPGGVQIDVGSDDHDCDHEH